MTNYLKITSLPQPVVKNRAGTNLGAKTKITSRHFCKVKVELLYCVCIIEVQPQFMTPFHFFLIHTSVIFQKSIIN